MNRNLKAAIASPLVILAAIGMMGSKASCSGPKLAGVTSVKPIGWDINGQPIYSQPIWKKPITLVYGGQPTKPPLTGAMKKGRNLGWQWIRVRGKTGKHGAPEWRVGRLP